ncbi:diguanylate cyclase [Paraconexibacter antarcticus]|uniref:Diguanylate cyclase n=1 Tax=Paraconexibacter antarcticus TaxID=2949664 RepID=A0ABY5E1C4_9ACTN|nr:diguanylate cyclase [Paraconexibacter antarcticus]UTI66624.1 diguanylate cyclase [Paraconexibacter antarcticus]
MTSATQVPPPATAFPAGPVLDCLADGIIATDAVERLIVYANDAACEITGYAREELLGRSPGLLQGPATDTELVRRLHEDLAAGRSFNGQTTNYRKDGTPFTMEWSISTLFGPDGDPEFHVAVQRDATLPARRLLDAERTAHTDALTGLPNRTHLDRVMEGGTWFSTRARSALVIDLDRFKQINDTHGHLVGDEVLRLFSRRLTECLRSEDLVARWGGEEFCVIILGGHEQAAVVAQHIVRAVAARPFATSAGELVVTASVGSASVTEERTTVSELLRAADGAMYNAKRLGRGRAEHA